ncbi:hypothetical protein KAM546c_08940 [Enterobacter roggenkampii]|nr:hypothetical protein KAM546c_08940 [Enterobacter roggenkampii]
MLRGLIQHSPLRFEWTGINLFIRFAIIAALPEPAYGPTHGLLSRRSTDRISTSPLANFAQLSMFRFDGLKITLVMSDGNNLIYNINHISYKLMITK